MTRHTASTITDDELDALYARLDAREAHARPGQHSEPAQRPTCSICTRDLWSAERHRYACRPCERRIRDHLAQLPALVQDLHGLLMPGARTDAPAYRTRTCAEPPAPINLSVLDTITAVTVTLDSWLRDWHEQLAWDAPTYRKDPLGEAASALRLNVPWAVERHPAVAEFATEIGEAHRTVAGLLDPATRARRIGYCPASVEDDERHSCGAALRYVPGATTVTCSWCRTTWDALDLSAALAEVA
ncbi:hypothetical protein [Streptomyces sp. NPDC037389]|uniref:zinc finger domain-containing protein n=1 Tax=Streptomyces sp. NPDC037389 TaxID=3155369 RepID=UPI0033F77E79